MHPPDACNQPTPGAQRRMERGQSRAHDIGRDEDQGKPDQLKGPGLLDVRHTLTPHSHAIDEPVLGDRAVCETERSIEDVNAHYPHGWQRLGEGARKLGDARSYVEHRCARLCETFRQSSELAGDRRREQTSGRGRCTSLGEERVVVRVPSRLGSASLCRFDCLSHRTHDRLAECAVALYTQVRQPWRENEIPVRTSDREPALNQDTFDWRIEFIV